MHVGFKPNNTPMRKVLLVAPLVALLAGCSWLQPQGQPTDVEETTVGSTPVSQPEESTVANDVSTTELRRPDLGFALRHPSHVNVVERTTCFEACPLGAAAPNFGFQTAGADVTDLSAFSSESQALQHFGTGAPSIASYIESGQVQELYVRQVPNGTIYSFVKPGIPASTEPSFFGNEGTPDSILSVLTAANGYVYTFNAVNGEATPLVEDMLASLELI
jgi:hypothetical protein